MNNKEKKFIANYKDKKQEKWFPIGEVTEAGLVFSDTSCERWNAYSIAVVGAPFVSPTSAEAKRIFIEYLPIYKKYLRITN